MTQFAYKAIVLNTGGVIAGRQEANDERSLRALLKRDGLVVIEARPVHVLDALRASLNRSRLTRSDRLWFFQTLRDLLAGQVPVESALATMEELAERQRLAESCRRVREALRAGTNLADAVGAQEGLATAQQIALLRSGLDSGKLGHCVELIYKSMLAGDKLRRTVTGRLIYPAILLAASVIVVWFLATMVIPRFAQTLEALGGELPLPTAITLVGAKWLMWGIPLAAVGALVLFSLRRQIVPDDARIRLLEKLLNTPIVGTLIWNNQAAVIADTTATMIEGGADVVSSLTQAQEAVTHPVVAERLRVATKQVREGVELGRALGDAKVFPPMATALVNVGMRGGNLVHALRRASEQCARIQEQITERLLTLMEPAIVVFLATVVGWVVYSLVTGMMAMSDVGGL